MKRISALILAVVGMALYGQGQAQSQQYPFNNPDLPIEQRVENLLELLTPQEKIGLMMNSSSAVERLGIPAYDWWNEALHGVARAGIATMFPQAIGLAATWNDEEVFRTFTIVSDEARAKYNQALRENNRNRYYGLTFWTPNINIFRDPRWGRGQETYGEDPYLTSRMGVACIKGLQGDHPKYFKTHACAKHYAVHSGPEWSRHSYDAEISDRDLWETYLPAFEAAVKEANVQEVMCAYNAFKGKPCCGSDKLLIDILRNRWGYKGLVVSDCGAINDFYMKNHHETHPTAEASSADAVRTGTDLECGSVYRNLNKALEEGLITEKEIDVSLGRLLKSRFELGMFDPAERVPWSSLPYSIVSSKPHLEQAEKMARQSIVLLKNDKNVLPLDKNIKKIAVIGPNAADSVMLWGNYNGTPQSTVTILEGIRRKLPKTEIVYESGSSLVEPIVHRSLIADFTTRDNRRGMEVRFYNNPYFGGTPAAKLVNDLEIVYNNSGGAAVAQGVDKEGTSTSIEGRYKATYTGDVVFAIRASDGYQLFVNAKLVSQKNSGGKAEYRMAVREGWTYDVRFEHVQKHSGMNIEMSVYREEPTDYAAIASKVADVDAIIYVGGLSPRLEGEEMSVPYPGFKGGDRTSIELPEVQRKMLATLRSTGKPVVFVLCSGSALALTDDEKNYDALLAAWYGGQTAGTAVADVLVGDYNPAGRLPVTFYKSLEQLDGALLANDTLRRDFENYNMQGRTYRYMTEKPLYPFGYGLSYSTFDYGRATLSAQKVEAGTGLTITVPVKNTSSRDGEEVVQVYVRRFGDAHAPLKSLRAFKRVAIKAGQVENVTLNIDSKSFEFYDDESSLMMVKRGSYQILYGGSSDDAVLRSMKIKVR